jgi:hypothetical protein
MWARHCYAAPQISCLNLRTIPFSGHNVCALMHNILISVTRSAIAVAHVQSAKCKGCMTMLKHAEYQVRFLHDTLGC